MEVEIANRQVYIVALIENRAKEVGCAALDLDSMTIHIHQFIEAGSSYTNTLMLLETFNPQLVIMTVNNRHSFSSGLVSATMNYNQQGVARSLFDDTNGLLLLEKYACNGNHVQDAGITNSHYLALGAAGAVLTYATQELQHVIASNTLEVSIKSTHKHAWIDSDTVRVLSIVPLGSNTGGTSSTGNKRLGSLFTLLNHTQTKGGARLLRASLLQPLTEKSDICMRLDSVQELVEQRQTLSDVISCLSCLPKNLERITGTLALQKDAHHKQHAKAVASLIDALVLLKQLLKCLPGLFTVLEEVSTPLLQSVRHASAHPVFQDILDSIEALLDGELEPTKVAAFNKVGHCFAVKAQDDTLLSLARTSFARATEAINQLAERYRQDYESLNLQMAFSKRLGWYLSIRPIKGTGPVHPSQLPSGFMVLDRSSKGTLNCTTNELTALNTRLQAAADDCLLLTHEILQDTVDTIVGTHLRILRKLCDGIALLDMLASLAQFVVSSGGEYQYTRPDFSDSAGMLLIVQGRHPLMERHTAGGNKWQPNDTQLSALTTSLAIIQGPNMSGKTVYLKQVALIAVMAQIGCFVPAEYVCITPFDHIMSRMGTEDNVETNSSGFMVEMQEMAYILHHASPRSLVLVDELGRSTSTEDAVAIGWAISEELIHARAPTLFATHLPKLQELPDLYPNCQLMSLQVSLGSGERARPIEFKHILQPGGIDQHFHYGLALSERAGWPANIIQDAKGMVDMMQQDDKRLTTQEDAGAVAWLGAAYDLLGKAQWLVQEAVSQHEEGNSDDGDDDEGMFVRFDEQQKVTWERLTQEAAQLIEQGRQQHD